MSCLAAITKYRVGSKYHKNIFLEIIVGFEKGLESVVLLIARKFVRDCFDVVDFLLLGVLVLAWRCLLSDLRTFRFLVL